MTARQVKTPDGWRELPGDEPRTIDFVGARAAWVLDWWENNKWLGAKGAVPEVRNLCEDVPVLLAEHVALLARVETLEAALRSIVTGPIRDYPEPFETRSPDEIARAALAPSAAEPTREEER